ncbi:MAG: hypothetical protein QUT30_11920 [Acidobacteriota bacterium]|nr:hypothetical protein [Acidobacteriota bacterium]
MPSNGFCDLGSLTKHCAESVVETQRIFNNRYRADLEVVAPAVRRIETVLGMSGPSAVLPARMLARHMEFKIRLVLKRSRACAFTLMAEPVNLGFRVSHESEESTESWLCMELDQLPVPRP